MIKFLYVPAAIIGVCLIPVAFVIAIPDFIRSMRDAYEQHD